MFCVSALIKRLLGDHNVWLMWKKSIGGKDIKVELESADILVFLGGMHFVFVGTFVLKGSNIIL